jgi:hypothetical protein
MNATVEKRALTSLVIKSLFVAWFLASLLYAHGCHGDEDHELFTNCVEWMRE